MKFQGPMIGDNFTLTSSTQAKWLPFNTLAPGMPSMSSGASLTVIPSSWNEG